MLRGQPQDSALSRPLQIGGNGLKVAVKECLGIKGIPTRCGSPVFAENPSETENATVVDSLIAAGCAIIGTANMHELAFGVTGINRFLGTPLNPRWPDRIPGGSSSGAASLVASASCDFAVGTDTGGSVRMPACCCGVFGMKPTFGRISRKGAVPATTSLDCIGPLAGSAELLTQAMECMDPSFRREEPAGPFRIVNIDVRSESRIAQAFAAAMGGLTVSSSRLDGLDSAYDAGLVVINAEIADTFGEIARHGDGMDEAVRGRILSAAEQFSPDALDRAEQVRAVFRREVDDALQGFDALALPTMPVVPPTLDQAGDMRALLPLTAFVRPFNLSGHPAITVPIRTSDGLPAGIQLVGRFQEDARLCAVAEWLVRQMAARPQNVGDNRS